jgi:hypothetical protein
MCTPDGHAGTQNDVDGERKGEPRRVRNRSQRMRNLK